MDATQETRLPQTCGEIRHCSLLPGGPAEGEAAPWAVFFLNGIGLDHMGFQDTFQALGRPLTLAKHPYLHGHHVAITVPGFEDAADRPQASLFTMDEQARCVAGFMVDFLKDHPAKEVVLYGFSYGSDLAVDVLEHLPSGFPLSRVLLSEMNVNRDSCFITRRICESYEAAKGSGPERNKAAHSGFVSRIMRAHVEGRISARLMQDMSVYCHTIAKKDWHQLFLSAREASADPERRVERLLERTARFPSTRFEAIFSTAGDLEAFQRRLTGWSGALGQIRVFDATRHEHFHHMGRHGVLDNLAGRLQEAKPLAR